jgi:hypothetical protein
MPWRVVFHNFRTAQCSSLELKKNRVSAVPEDGAEDAVSDALLAFHIVLSPLLAL